MANPRRRVYWKELRRLLEKNERYIESYDTQLENNLTEPQMDCVLATLTAIQTCLALLPTNDPT